MGAGLLSGATMRPRRPPEAQTVYFIPTARFTTIGFEQKRNTRRCRPAQEVFDAETKESQVDTRSVATPHSDRLRERPGRLNLGGKHRRGRDDPDHRPKTIFCRPRPACEPTATLNGATLPPKPIRDAGYRHWHKAASIKSKLTGTVISPGRSGAGKNVDSGDSKTSGRRYNGTLDN